MSKSEKRKIILIVEDEISLRNALRIKLLSQGYIVFDAKDGEIGLAIALAKKPDLILLDIIMPKMDGMSMLKRLRKEEKGNWVKTVPVILLTNLGADDKNMTKDILEDKYTYYLVKSNSSLNELTAEVKIKLELK